MRAWMNKNAELQEKFNDGRLLEENQKIREEKAQQEKEQDDKLAKLSKQESKSSLEQNTITQTDTHLQKELGEWQETQKAIKANSADEDLSKLSPEELVRKINTLHEANDLLIKAVEVTRSRHEQSHELLKDSFRQVIADKDKELEQKSYEVQDLKERVSDLEQDYGRLVSDYNALDTSKSHQNTKSLFDDKAISAQQSEQATEKIPVMEITIVRLEGPSYLCDIENKTYSFKEANELLKEMSKKAPRTVGYDKTNFSIVFADGEKYEGRIDLMHYTIEKNSREQNVEQHIHDHLSFYNGTLKPEHMSQQSYDDFLAKNTNEQGRQEINEFLEKYIPDEARHPRIQSQEQVKAQSQSNELSAQKQSATIKADQQVKDKSKSRGGDGGLGY